MKYNLEDIKNLIKKSKYNYQSNSWFFPSDLIPHSSSLKYACKKLYERGELERHGNETYKWGYQYRIKDVKEEK